MEPFDNDGDADDADGDGYVNGHEILAGTNPFDPSVFPDGDPMPASAFIDEDDYDWSAIGTGFASGDAAVSVSVGVDDDGDCWRNASATPPTNSSRMVRTRMAFRVTCSSSGPSSPKWPS